MLGSPITQSPVILIVTVVAVVRRGDRDDRVIMAVVEVLRGRWLVVVAVAGRDKAALIQRVTGLGWCIY